MSKSSASKGDAAAKSTPAPETPPAKIPAAAKARARKPAAKAAKVAPDATAKISAKSSPKSAVKSAAPTKSAPAKAAPAKAASAAKPAPKAPAETAKPGAEPSATAVVEAAPEVQASPVHVTPAQATKEMVEAVTSETVKAVNETVKQASVTVQAAAAKTFPPAADGIEALYEMQRTALETWMEAGSKAAKNLETIGEDVAALSKATVDTALANGEKLLECRTVQDVFAWQAEFAMQHMTAYLDKGAEISQKALQIAEEARAPFEAQAQKAFGAATMR